jgi:endogenous inhibitor of DNA gyrase (YacG/DUF329 family)
VAKRQSTGARRRPRSTHGKTEETIARIEKKAKALYREYTVACPHCGEPILSSMFASAAAKRASGMRIRHGAGTGRPKKLSPCPGCGGMFGAAEMRRHRPGCSLLRNRI